METPSGTLWFSIVDFLFCLSQFYTKLFPAKKAVKKIAHCHMFLELNIDSSVGETLLLSSETFINSISICNTGSVDFKLSMYKRKQNDASVYFYLKDVTIRQQNIFLGEDIGVAVGDTFYVSIDSGNCSVIVDYK